MKTATVVSIILIAYVAQASAAVLIEKSDDLYSSNWFKEMNCKRPSWEAYKVKRQKFQTDQLSRGLGYDVELSAEEEKVNEIFMDAKNAELYEGLKSPYNFAPSRHFFDVLAKVNGSTLFKLIRKMPKGAVLHAHDTALCSTDYIVSQTYRDNLWQCGELTEDNRPDYIFSKLPPAPKNECTWTLVEDERRKMGAGLYDKRIRKLLTLYNEDPINAYKDINDVWSKFMGIFMTLDPIVTYVPVWRDYFYNALKEFYEDGVMYLEFRGLLPALYDFDGGEYGPVDVVQIYVDVLKKFKKDYPNFIGCKFIYAPIRLTDDETIDNYLATMLKLHDLFPDFVAGFDLVGQEDLGRPLIEYAEKLLKLPEYIKFFFHAGETNWNGQSSDENVIDAVLLGTKRIGHGFAIVKNPNVLEEIKARNICIEINPISNQVLKLVDDYRNHPAAIYFSDNYPVVISSDDPSFWEATPLSHDFYQAFLGIASAHHDLRLLKKLAMNSLDYSAMTPEELRVGKEKWTNAWNEFITTVLSENGDQ